MTDRAPDYGDKWFFVAFAVIIVTLVLAKFARAEEVSPTSGPSSAPVVEVVPLPAGVPAPFDGLLVPESIFIGYMKQEIRITELTMKLELRDRLLAEKPAVTKTAPTFGVGWSFILGVGAGVLVSSLIVYGAVQILESR